jgi:hypothetical protein
MTRQDFDDHQVFKTLASARQGLESQKDKVPPDAAEQYNLLRHFVDALELRLRALDPALINKETLRELASPLGQVSSKISNGVGLARLQQALASADAAAVVLGRLPAPGAGEVELVVQEAERLRTYVDETISNAGATIEELKNQAKSAIAEIESEQTAVTAQLDAHKTLLDGHQQRVDSELKRQVDEGEEARKKLVKEASEKIAGAVATATERGNKSVGSFDKKAKEALDTIDEDAQARRARLEELKAEAEEMTGFMASATLASASQRAARMEMLQAHVFRVLAVAALAGAVAWGIFHVVNEHDASALAAKGGVGLAILALAGYCARESSQHRKEARRLRERELQLSTIDAYFSELEPAARAERKAELAARFFTGASLQEEKHEADPAPFAVPITVLDAASLLKPKGRAGSTET